MGAEGRGDLALVTLWAYIAALIATFGLPYAHRFWTAHKPEWKPEIFTVTIVFTMLVGGIAVGLSEIIVPLYVGERSPEVMWLMRLFLLNIPVLMFNEMMRGMLEGAQLFGWLGAARLSFILTQAGGYLIFWAFDVLTLPIAVILITAGQILCVTIMFAGIWRELSLNWSWNFSVFRKELSYGFRSYPGIVTEFAVLRLDQIILAGFASSFIFGLYTVAVSLAEITATLASSVADALMPEVASSNDQERSTAASGEKFAADVLRASARADPALVCRAVCFAVRLWRGICRGDGDSAGFVFRVGSFEFGRDRHQRSKRFRASRTRHDGAPCFGCNNRRRVVYSFAAVGNDGRGGRVSDRLRRDAGGRSVLAVAQTRNEFMAIPAPAPRGFFADQVQANL